MAGAVLRAGFGVRQHLATDPLILPSVLANRGFTAGLLLGLAFLAAVNGLAYVISLFFQTALGLPPRAAAIAPCPLVIGMIIAYLICRPFVGKLGRLLVVIGLAARWPARGVVGDGPGRRHRGQRVGHRPLDPRARAGMGACISIIYDVAIGDVAPGEAGSASGPLSAVRQLAAAIGSAVVTSVYFSQRAHSGAAHAMTVSVAVGGAIVLLDLGLVWLLPKSAPQEQH